MKHLSLHASLQHALALTSRLVQKSNAGCKAKNGWVLPQRHRAFAAWPNLSAYRLLLALGIAPLCILLPTAAHAVTSGQVQVTAITPFAAIDSNNACTEGPTAMYVQVNVKNTSSTTLTNLSANINTFTNSKFKLKTGELPDRFIGNLAPNATASLYWFVSYCESGNADAQATNYSVTLTDGVGPFTQTGLSLTARSSIKAAAGGDVASLSIGSGVVAGQIVKLTVNYSFGNPASAADVQIQPAGNVSFNPACYQLKNAVINTSSFTTGPVTGSSEKLYFTGVNGGASNALTVFYFFKALCTNQSTIAKPFAEQKSGGPQKYTGNFSTLLGATLPQPTNPFIITKAVSSTSPSPLPTAGGTATYTITIENTSSFESRIEKIVDVLPTGLSFLSTSSGTGSTSSTILSNSSKQPTTGATGTIEWVAQPSATAANDLYVVPAKSSIKLIYSVTVPSGDNSYLNSATAQVGTLSIGPATAIVAVGPVDRSDAPISGTAPNGTGTNNYGEATHTVGSTNTLKLGAAIDSEAASIASANASGDGADDDGVTLPNLTAGATSYSIPAANIIATGTGTLHAWIDFNKNGTFDVGEYKSVAINSNTPASALSWSGITIGSVGNTFARFRFTTDTTVTSATPSSNAINGEVEDYQVFIGKQTINNTPSATSCSVLGGTLSGNNLFMPLDNGTFGVENGSPNQSPTINPYPGVVSGGNYRQFYSTSFTFGDYSYVANAVTPRNASQHPGITDPVYGATGRFFASDPNTSTPTLTTTLTGLTPNQFYEYSFWAANSEPNGNPNEVYVLINGQRIYTTGPLTAFTAALEWKKHTVSFSNGASTSIIIDLKSIQTGNAGNDFYLDNIELRGCNFTVDYGDAPPSYGDAIHTTIPATPNIYLGVVAPDGETSTPLGGDNGVGADGDDANQSSDDEDAFTALNSIPITGTYALNNIPVKNTSGGNVTLHAWIDFNRDGKFSVGEYQSTTVANNATTSNLSWTVPNTAIAGNTYARFRITPNALAVDNVSTTDVDERSKDAVINGEVEDYQVAIAPKANVLLVKRITAINGDRTKNPNDNTAFNTFVDDTTSIYQTEDNNAGWPSSYLLGAIDAGKVKPGDDIEYTVYFLNSGGVKADSVKICDLIAGAQDFKPNAYGTNQDIELKIGKITNASTFLTQANDVGDRAQVIDSAGTVPAGCNLKAANTNSTVVLDVTGTTGAPTLTTLPNTTGTGTPDDSFGFFRFVTKVKP
jgi:uncharacterized repeat protein (TIGR01451 family)